MRNFQFPEEIDFTRSKKKRRKKRQYTPLERTWIQRMTIALLMVMLFGTLLVLAIVFS